MSDPFTWTAGQLTRAVSDALRDRDMEAAVAFLKILAVVDPVQAQAVLDTIEAGIAISRAGG